MVPPRNVGEQMRRYVIHADQSATWLLVSSQAEERWHIQRLGPQGEMAWFELPAFEASDAGRKLAPKLKGALMEAERDR